MVLFPETAREMQGTHIPRFTEQDAIDSAENVLDAFVTDTVTFGELWRNRKTAIKVPMEETVFKKWHYGRTVIIGDSAHKVNRQHHALINLPICLMLHNSSLQTLAWALTKH